MPVAIYINETSQVERLINWGVRAAVASHDDLLIIVPRRQKGSPKWDPLEKHEADQHETFKAVFDTIENYDSQVVVLKENVTENIDSHDMSRVVVETRELVANNPALALIDMVSTLDSVRLIIPATNNLKTDSESASWAQRLYMQAPCETMMVWGGPPPPEQPQHVLVVADANTESPLAARRAVQLSRSVEDGSARLLFVWPDDDEVAPQIAKRKADAIVGSLGSARKEVTAQTWIGNSMAAAIESVESESFDTVMAGCRNIKKIRSLVRSVKSGDAGKSLAVVRPSVSIGRKVLRDVQASIRQVVPQLGRDERIDLVEKLETNSRFNFDFCALISLSTLIAALGLADDSTAVVIGAMLVAPLMTPLVGIGFALIQGNLELIRRARWAVLVGFANAFAIGVVIGFLMLICGIGLTSEMRGRDWPGLLDLFVALASGIAGAYAFCRKELNGAIAGVAIAAALVPPIATSGMAFSLLEWKLCIGAFLLFLTNVVFIVLGTSIVFWSVGIDTRPRKSKAENRPQYLSTRYWFGTFVVASIILAVGVTIGSLTSDRNGKQEENNVEQNVSIDTDASGKTD